MTSSQITSNPFAQMMDPQAVIAAVERSERLQRLQSRVCRPLDKVLGGAESAESEESLATSVDAVLELAGESEADVQNVMP